jgi:hypothetical protein
MTALNKRFLVAFCFMPSETEEDYLYALGQFVDHVVDYWYPEVFLSDNETALKNACSKVLLGVPQLLCIWHVNNNVLTQVQKTWKDNPGSTSEVIEELEEQRNTFMCYWREVIYSKTPALFEERYSQLKQTYRY